MDDNEFLGKGMKFPIQVDPATGRFMISEKQQSVKESVYLILSTRRGERLARPLFGSKLDSYVFMDVNAGTIAMMKRDISMTILSQEPRISNVDISVEHQAQAGRLIININYTISGTDTKDNLVFPFYLDREAAEAFAEEEEDFADTLSGVDESVDLDE